MEDFQMEGKYYGKKCFKTIFLSELIYNTFRV